MKVRAIVLVALIGSWAVLLSARATSADASTETDLQARIKQLETRVAELERTIRQLRASVKVAPRTETETRVVGTWVVADADKKAALFTDLKLNGDGTCAVVTARTGSVPAAKYQVIGKQIVITAVDGGASFMWERRIISVNDTELVTEQKNGNEAVKVRYQREK